MTICCGTIVSSVMSAKIIRLLGTGRVAAISTAMTAAALLGFSFSGSLPAMCLWAIPLGLGAGAIDTALNNYVALHYSARVMSFLHCFFGVGVTISPFVLSLVISGERGWRGGYRIAFAIQLAITLLLTVTLPVWRKVHQVPESGGQGGGRDLSLREIARIPGVKLMWSLFITSCAIECTCGNWASTFLVEYKHVPAERAARIVMFYYAGMALGRFLSGLLAAKLDSWRIIRLGQIVLGAALAVLLNAPICTLPDSGRKVLRALERLCRKYAVPLAILAEDGGALAQVMDYLERRVDQPLTLDQIAGRFYISKHYLCRIFKAATGFSVMEYIIYSRVLRARQLLQEGVSVQQAGELSGFSDNSHFIRTFGHLTGLTPGKYAKEYQSGDQVLL